MKKIVAILLVTFMLAVIIAVAVAAGTSTKPCSKRGCNGTMTGDHGKWYHVMNSDTYPTGTHPANGRPCIFHDWEETRYTRWRCNKNSNHYENQDEVRTLRQLWTYLD